MSDFGAMTSPFDTLLDYEQRSLAHVAGLPEQIDAPGLWRGIAFRLGRRMLASSIAEVTEILSFPVLTTVPGSKFWLMGVANVRGNLVSVVDIRGFIEGERSTHNEKSRVLVIRQQGSLVGLLVDEILGQRAFVDANLREGEREDDERYRRYVERFYEANGAVFGIFSMAALTRTPEFIQAAV